MHEMRNLFKKLHLYLSADIRYILVLLIFLSARGTVYAQNNPYKIDDSLYDEFKSISKTMGTPECPKLCDAFFIKALKINDMMGQSLAIATKASHYVTIQDIDKLKKTVEQARACKTIKLSYRYVVWKQLVTQYLLNNKIKEAHDEIERMQSDAIKEKSEYGIVKSYVLYGIYFTVLLNEPAAIEQYHKAFEIAGNNYLLYDYIEACNYASLLISNLRFDEAIEILNLGLAYPNMNTKRSFPLYMRFLQIYTNINYTGKDKNKKAKEVKEKLEKEIKEGLVPEQSVLAVYHNALFAYYINVEKNYLEADKYLASFKDSISYYENKAELLGEKGEYKNAYILKNKAIDLYIRKNRENQYEVQKVYDLRSSLDEALREKDRLMLANTKLLLDKSREHEALLQLHSITREKELNLNQAELSRQIAESKQQSEMMRHQQQELKQAKEYALLQKQNMRWRYAFSVIGFMLVLGFFIAYILMHQQKERMLRAQRDKAQEDERMKSLFLQNMSHEIRTPLNAIIGFNDIINNEEMKDLLQPGEREELLSMIHTNADLLSTLVNDVLDISKFESGTYLMNIVNVNICDLCKTVLESIRMRAKSGVMVEFKSGMKELMIDTDAQRLQQVLTNFLTNACKYTSKGSIILSCNIVDCPEIPAKKEPQGMVAALPAGKYVRFAVTDTGTGVPKGEEEKCFTRFQMLDKNVKGTGLGLHICRLISHMLHGHVYVDTSYTQGARFVFDHPINLKH